VVALPHPGSGSSLSARRAGRAAQALHHHRRIERGGRRRRRGLTTVSVSMVARAATLVIVPLLSIVGHEVWTITGHLRYKTPPADPTLTMRAVVYSEHGAARDVLRLVSDARRPLSPAAPNTLVVKVVGAALNPVDFKMRRNEQPQALIPKPKIPGYDVSGIVVDAGDGSHGFQKGDRVFGMLPIVGNPWGGLAELVAADASVFAKAPSSIPLVEAAALPLVGLTVMQTLASAGLEAPPAVMLAAADSQPPVQQRALVQAAAGGVGSFAVQYLRNVLRFSEVLATASPANAEFVAALGATRTIDYHTEQFEAVASAAGGVDVVLDPMAWSYMDRTLGGAGGAGGAGSGMLRPAAKYCHILSSDWASNDMERDPLLALKGPLMKWTSRARRLLRRDAPQVFSSAVQPDGAGLAQLARLVDAGRLKPVVGRVFEGLEQAVEAFELLETGHARGKVVVRVSSE
jgi:NADPH:quinone reductase-like Zn-dependent oxidoreductase